VRHACIFLPPKENVQAPPNRANIKTKQAAPQAWPRATPPAALSATDGLMRPSSGGDLPGPPLDARKMFCIQLERVPSERDAALNPQNKKRTRRTKTRARSTSNNRGGPGRAFSCKPGTIWQEGEGSKWRLLFWPANGPSRRRQPRATGRRQRETSIKFCAACIRSAV